MQHPNSCELGCTDAHSFGNSSQGKEKNSIIKFSYDTDLSLHSPVYPTASNPVQAPLVTQIGTETRFMIDITHSVPSNLSINLGYSTLIVRVQDKSSRKDNDFTYYTLVRMITIHTVTEYVIIDSHNFKHTS